MNSTKSKDMQGSLHLQKTDILKSPPPHDLQIIRGSAYGIFSHDFIKYVLTNKIAHALLAWSMDTYSPDEHYWATLNHLYYNPHLKTPGGYKNPANTKLWVASYSAWPDEDLCYGRVIRNTSPCVFGVKDVPQLVKREEFFANKFFMDYQPMAQLCLSEFIQTRARCQTGFDTTFYKKLTFVKNKYLVQR